VVKPVGQDDYLSEHTDVEVGGPGSIPAELFGSLVEWLRHCQTGRSVLVRTGVCLTPREGSNPFVLINAT
jgi:hypothetical protein